MSDDPKVVSLSGEIVPQKGQPVGVVVEHLEELLRAAKAGHLHCFAGAYDTPNGVRWLVAGSGVGFDMIGGLEMAKQRIVGGME